jgi:pyrroline-5-carboxylate reductase
MSGHSTGFIGGGRITRIFLSGWNRAKAMPSKVVVSDTDSRVLSNLKDTFTAIEAAPGMEYMLAGAMATMRGAELDAKAVQDLIPVRPLADLEPTILDAYRAKLKAVFEKIKP